MKSLRVFVSIAIVFVLTGVLPLSGQTRQRPRRPPAADAEIKALIARYYSAWSARDLDAAAALYTNDATAEFYDIRSVKAVGWPRYSESTQQFLRRFTELRMTPNDDLKVVVAGTNARTTVTFHSQGTTVSGEPIAFEGRQTAIWEKRSGGWQIVHEHVSAPLPPPQAPPPPPPTLTPADEQAVRSVITRYAAAWNAGDAEALASLWHGDGDVMSMAAGTATVGRPGIRKMWGDVIARRPKTFSTRISGETDAVRFPSPEVAIVDGIFVYTDSKDRRATVAARERFAATLTKKNGTWALQSVRVVLVPSR